MSETGISPLYGDEQFSGIEIYSSLLTIMNAGDNLSSIDGKRILGTRLGYTAQATFLVNNFTALKILLDESKHRATLRDIEGTGRARSEL